MRIKIDKWMRNDLGIKIPIIYFLTLDMKHKVIGCREITTEVFDPGFNCS